MATLNYTPTENTLDAFVGALSRVDGEELTRTLENKRTSGVERLLIRAAHRMLSGDEQEQAAAVSEWFELAPDFAGDQRLTSREHALCSMVDAVAEGTARGN